MHGPVEVTIITYEKSRVVNVTHTQDRSNLKSHEEKPIFDLKPGKGMDEEVKVVDLANRCVGNTFSNEIEEDINEEELVVLKPQLIIEESKNSRDIKKSQEIHTFMQESNFTPLKLFFSQKLLDLYA